jgi:phosphatidylglycerophosphatase A
MILSVYLLLFKDMTVLVPDMKTQLIILGTAFLAFRAFDIVKPPPCRRLENLPAGWGILADDLMAGVYAGIVSSVAVHMVL